MIITVLLIAVLLAIAGWWLSHQRLTAKPWLEEGIIGEHPGAGTAALPAAKLGLGVFLAVVGSLFALFASAYAMRMHMADWRPLPVPGLLWLNTVVLVASSLALQGAVLAARRGRAGDTRAGLVAAGLTTLLFLVGQVLAWHRLAEAGHVLTTSPASSFFYLITAVHGLHLVGGLVALGRAAAGAWRQVELERVRASVELCAVYWHFLLLVWALIFGMLLHG